MHGILVIAAALAGCGSREQRYFDAASLPSPDSGQGAIICYRRYSAGGYGDGQRGDVLVDDREVGVANPDDFLRVPVSPGPHRLVVQNVLLPGENALEVVVPAGGVVYVEAYLTESAMRGRTELRLVDAATALDHLRRIGGPVTVTIDADGTQTHVQDYAVPPARAAGP